MSVHLAGHWCSTSNEAASDIQQQRFSLLKLGTDADRSASTPDPQHKGGQAKCGTCTFANTKHIVAPVRQILKLGAAVRAPGPWCGIVMISKP